MTRHLLDIEDLDAAELARILALAHEPRPEPVLAGTGVALIFEKPSNRTRNATEMAVVALGGHPIVIRGEEIGLGVRESVADVTHVLAGYHRVIAARVNDHRVLEEMAEIDVVPIVNLLSDRSHPCQTLADLLTLSDHWGDLAGRTVAWVGDGNNVARSLLQGAALSGMSVRVASPAGHSLDDETVSAARALGAEVLLTEDPSKAVEGADAVCTDVWVSMGQEAENEERLATFARYQVDGELMGRAAPGAVFLHCLPAHRGLEVSAGVIDGPASLVFPQAHNRMHAARGLLMWLAEQSPGRAGPSA